MTNKKVVLFDIDHSLFNGKLYRKKMYEAFAKKSKFGDTEKFRELADEVYINLRKKGPFLPDIFTKILVETLHLPVSPEELVEIIWDEDILRLSLFEEAEEALKELSTDQNITLGILSSGPPEFQRAKIKSLERFFHKDHMHIFYVKTEKFSMIVEKYKDDRLYVIDDLLKILEQLKSANPAICTIWSKKGIAVPVGHEKKVDFRPDYAITNLHEVVEIIRKD